ncbi:MAG TPA: magnesium-translocating P-type ATPase [Pseudonocardia sp.]|nr:magnesium-translocating P-type ATPase [Pseudonocardia sp.]
MLRTPFRAPRPEAVTSPDHPVTPRDPMAEHRPTAPRELAEAPVFTVFQRLGSTPAGLTESEAAERQRRGDNALPEPGVTGSATSPAARALAAVRSPFVALLAGLGVVFVLVGDPRGALTVTAVVLLSIGLRAWQHTRSDRALRALHSQVSHTVTVRRRAGEESEGLRREVPLADLVPGDVVLLGAGDVVPADLRVVAATDLVVDQSALSGEALPVAKRLPGSCRRPAAPAVDRVADRVRRRLARRTEVVGPRAEPVDATALCFAGTSVVGGSGTAVVITTGPDTYLGSIARQTERARPESGFDLGVRSVGWTLIRFMLVMVPIVLAVNGTVTGDWTRAAMFAAAVAVGLTPEMLPVIVTTNLARGALLLSRRKVIVKRLNAIQDLGAVDVLCVDKTGTLTEDRVAFACAIDAAGRPDAEPVDYAYLAVHFRDEPGDRLDEAIVAQLAEDGEALLAEATYDLVDEIGFDHARRRHTVVLRRGRGEHLLITKGDPDEVLPRCCHAREAGAVVELTGAARGRAAEVARTYARHGMRVLAVAARQLPARLGGYGEADESDLVLVGFVGFVDPVREGAAEALRSLRGHGVAVKILTGDNRYVAERVGAQVGVPVHDIVLGARLDRLDDVELAELVGRTSVFAKLNPAHKARIVAVLRAAGHSVGFVGDGVNDVAALRHADVGIAPDTATEVAKAAADLILLDKDLSVLAGGVVEGRRTLGNTLKYVNITASSNFGNVLTVVVASVFLPFLPILPIQLMAQNLLYDLAQLALPWDRVDADYLSRPRRWDASGLARFMVVFGPLSSLFDLSTFAVLWWVWHAGADPGLFQAGWFVEGLLTQLLIVFVLRGRAAPLGGSRPARAVLLATGAAALLGVLLVLTPLGGPLGLRTLPADYLLWLAVLLPAYGLAAHLVKALGSRSRSVWW